MNLNKFADKELEELDKEVDRDFMEAIERGSQVKFKKGDDGQVEKTKKTDKEIEKDKEWLSFSSRYFKPKLDLLNRHAKIKLESIKLGLELLKIHKEETEKRMVVYEGFESILNGCPRQDIKVSDTFEVWEVK